MSRTIVVALIAATTVLALTACAAGGRPTGAHSSLPAPQPRPSHSTAAPTAGPSASPAARLSTTAGDELLTFTGTGHDTDGSAVAVTFTVHAPVAWNSAGGSQTLAALAASRSAQVGNPAQDLRSTTWDAAKAASLAVVDYSATMVAGSWRAGEVVSIMLGPAESEVSVEGAGVTTEDDWWELTGPGSGHFVIAYKNNDGSSPDPSTWGDALQEYGLGASIENASPASYEFRDCRIDITPLGRRSAAVASWFSPTPDYCYAGVGE